MEPPPVDGRHHSYATPVRKRRRYTVWTLLAPAAVVALWIAFAMSFGSSCVFDGSCSSGSDDADAAEEADARNDVQRGGKTKVKAGDSLGSIAARFELTEEELKACNPRVDPQSLQPDTYLVVSAINCEEADKADVGANPDPLAGDTAAGSDLSAPDPANNGTAAADPSASADAGADDAA